MNIGFDNDKYLSMQSSHIKERISHFDNKLYLEFGGKLFDDYHASRVLPGFQPDSKLRMLKQLSEHAEIIIVISAEDIERNKIRGDLGITYDSDVLRLMEIYYAQGLFVGSVVITKYSGQESARLFRKRLEKMDVKVYRHYPIPGYPTNIPVIVSDSGYGKNDYIKTSRPLVVVTAPGPGSGKMAVCLSQLYHEHKRGIHAGYAKFETFPIWNIPLKHPVNLAYEAATADLNDVNMIDPFHLDAYGNDEACNEASKQEIIRRYYSSLRRLLIGECADEEVYKLEMLMNQAGITTHDRPVVDAALKREEESEGPAAALELHDGRIITGKTSPLLGASAALLLNTLKELAGINHEQHVISPEAIEPIQKLKTQYLGSKNPRLHTDEVLIALSVSAASDPDAQKALDQIPKLKGCQAHTSVMVSSVDMKQLQKLSIQATYEAKYEKKSISFNGKGI